MIGTIILGLIVGALARFLMPGEDKMGIILTIVLGIAGSLLAGFVGQALGLYQAGVGAGFIGSLVGALALLFVVGKMRNKGGNQGGGPSA